MTPHYGTQLPTELHPVSKDTLLKPSKQLDITPRTPEVATIMDWPVEGRLQLE